MAEREKEEKPSEEETPKKSKVGSWRTRLQQHLWICVLVGTTVVAHGLLIVVHALTGSSTESTEGEVSLGQFDFMNTVDQHDSVVKADFQLHVRLLDGIDKAARKLLSDRKYRVQQDVEELLRRAHGADFEDPSLSELKRQLQETVNQSLELRAVDEVIITELAIETRQRQADPGSGAQQAVTATGLPDKPAG